MTVTAERWQRMENVWIEGPRKIGLDLNLLKRVRLTENKTLEVRVDAVNALNHPQRIPSVCCIRAIRG